MGVAIVSFKGLSEVLTIQKKGSKKRAAPTSNKRKATERKVGVLPGSQRMLVSGNVDALGEKTHHDEG